MSAENSVSYEEEIIVEREVTRDVEVEIEKNDNDHNVERTVEVVTEVVQEDPKDNTQEVNKTFDYSQEIRTQPKEKKKVEFEGVSMDSEHSYEYSVEKIVEVDRVVETEIVRNGEVIEKKKDDKLLHLNYRKNRLTTFVKMMEFLKTTESSRFSHQSEMMKTTVKFKKFGEFLRLYLSDENRLKEFTEGKLKKEDVKKAVRMVVDEDMLEKMRQFYMINSHHESRVKEYSNLIDFARKQGEKDPEEEAKLVEIMEKGLDNHNRVQMGMYGLRSTDETEGIWGVAYVPFEDSENDALDDDQEKNNLIELPPIPDELENEGEEKWRENGFFVRNRSRRLAFNDALIVDRNSSELLGEGEKNKSDFESGKKVDFEYEIFGHLVIDMNNAMLWKKLKLDSEKVTNDRKIAVRKFLGKKKVTDIKDEKLKEEANDFIIKEESIEEEAKEIREEYLNSSEDLSKREELISKFFKVVSKVNNEDFNNTVFESDLNVDEYITRERQSERKFSSTTTRRKETRVMSIISGVEVTNEVTMTEEEIHKENSDYNTIMNPFVQEIVKVGDVYVSLYLMEVLEETPEKRQKALKEIISNGDFVFLKEEYRNLGITVETENTEERLFENEKWLYMIYFKGGYKRLFGLMDARFSHYRTDLVKIYEPGHTGQRYKSNFFNLTSKITERTNESISSEGSAHRRELVKWNYCDLESQSSEYLDWTRKVRLLQDVRQLSIREFMWSLGYLRSDSSIDGRIMPYWPFSPVRRDELSSYLEVRPQLKMIMMEQGKQVISRERDLSVSSTSTHEYERIYEKEVEKEVNVEIIEKGKKPRQLKRKSISSDNDIIVKDELMQSNSSLSSGNTSVRSNSKASKGVLLGMILWGSIVVGAILGSKIAVVNLIPPPSPPIEVKSSPITNVDPKTRVSSPTPTPNIPKKVKPKIDPPKPVSQPMNQKVTTKDPHIKFAKTKVKPIPKTTNPPTTKPPKKIQVVPVKKPDPAPKAPPTKDVFVNSHHENHTFVVEHHYIQPQFIIQPPQTNTHPPVININNETSSHSAASAPAPAPAPVVIPVSKKESAPQIIQQVPQPQTPTVINQQPNGPITVTPKIKFSPIIKPKINVKVKVKAPKTPSVNPPKILNKSYHNFHTTNNTNVPQPVVIENNMEKLVNSQGQVDEMVQAHNNGNMIVSDENELNDINALVNDIKMNVSTDQEMSDLKNLIIHRDMKNDARKTTQEEPMKIIIKHNHSHRRHHHHHHRPAGPSFVGILTTTIKKHKHSHGGGHSRKSSSFSALSHSHHTHHKHHNGFISQFRIRSSAPQAPPIKIKKSSEGKIKSSDELLSSEVENYKEKNLNMTPPTVTPVATAIPVSYGCSGHAVVPVSMNPNCNKKGKKHKSKKRRRKRKLKSLKKKHKKIEELDDDFHDFTEEPMLDNNDYSLDNIEDADLEESNKKWNHRFNMFNYFDNKKMLKKANSPQPINDNDGMISFNYPKMAMDMGMDMGLNDKDIQEVSKYIKGTKNLSI
jgi:hypothetical protein